MFTRTAVAALMVAAVPMMGITAAEAAKGSRSDNDGRTYHKYQKSTKGKKTVVKSTHTNKNKRYVITTTKTSIKTKNGTKSKTVIVRKENKPSYSKKWKKKLNGYYTGTGKYLKGIYDGRPWKNKKKWKKRYTYKCVVGAKKRYGSGNRLWGIGGTDYGPGACDRAMLECRSELRVRKKSGRNPRAKCVVIKRG